MEGLVRDFAAQMIACEDTVRSVEINNVSMACDMACEIDEQFFRPNPSVTSLAKLCHLLRRWSVSIGMTRCPPTRKSKTGSYSLPFSFSLSLKRPGLPRQWFELIAQ